MSLNHKYGESQSKNKRNSINMSYNVASLTAEKHIKLYQAEVVKRSHQIHLRPVPSRWVESKSFLSPF